VVENRALIKKRFLVAHAAILMVSSFLAGCSVVNPPTVVQGTEPLTTGTTPTEPTANLTLAPTPTMTVPKVEPVSLANPGFEDQEPGETPAGWIHTGTLEAVKLDEIGHSGNLRLTHQATGAYQVETSQSVSGLSNEWYTLRGWVRSSGGQNEAYLALKCGNEEKRVDVPPTTPGYRWLHLSVSNQVTDEECTIRLYTDGNPDTWTSFDDFELVPGQETLSILGADISSLKKTEDLGGIYKDANGIPTDALQILIDHGLNYARLRVWLDPADGYHNKAEILKMAARLKKENIKLLVDFHYSDVWADPGKQIKPAAWKDYDFVQLKKAVYDHTFDVCKSLAAQGTPPDMVQVGNEINAGILWPDGKYDQMDNLAALLKEGYRAVKDSSDSTLVMLHIAEGGDNELARWWFDNITRREVPFDVIGISYYPYWHGSLGELQYNLNDISARYDKDVIVVETSYAFTEGDNDNFPNIVDQKLTVPHYPLTPEGQRDMLRNIMSIVRAVDNGRGLGMFYWDATWTAVKGNGWDNTNPDAGNAWENQALFDFDGKVLPAMDEYLNP
jgi:arabinogalactan endo-1,4-beta-galactosidase